MKYFKNIAILLIVLIFAACEETSMPMFDAENSLIYIGASAYKVAENNPEILKIPVIVGSLEAGGTNVDVTFEVSGVGTNPAVEGVDYEIVSEEKKVSVTDGYGTAYIQVKAIDNDFYDKDKTFKITLKSNTAGYYISDEESGNAASVVTISDNEHPLAIVIGSYSELDYTLEDEEEGPSDVSISPVDGSETQVAIYNFWDGGQTIMATVDLEQKTISILPDQVIYISGDYGDCKAIRIDLNAGAYDPAGAIVGAYDDSGNITFEAWSARVEAGTFGNYASSVLTKQ